MSATQPRPNAADLPRCPTSRPDHGGAAVRLRYCGPEGLSFSQLFRCVLSRSPDLPEWPQLRNRAVVPTFLGRVAVWQLCKLWRLGAGDEILMPAYNCGTEIDPFLVAGCKVVLYRTNEVGRIDVQDLMKRRSNRTKVVYVTHYFGWPQDLRELGRWCRLQDLRLVEDCALALFSAGPEGELGTQGDAAIFSLGKFLPTPHGGLLTLATRPASGLPKLSSPALAATLGPFVNLLRKELQRKADSLGVYSALRRVRTVHRTPPSVTPGATLPDMPASYYLQSEIAEAAAPRAVVDLIRTISPEAVRAQRRANYARLALGIHDVPGIRLVFSELPAATCPLYLPVVAGDRSGLLDRLTASGVSAHPFWEGYHHCIDWSDFPEARFLKDHVVTLPINQSLTADHIDFLVRVVRGEVAASRRRAGAPVGN